MCSTCVTCVVIEIIPRLLQKIKRQEELDEFGKNIIDTIGDIYLQPIRGYVLWFIYKRFCLKDIEKFIECVNTKQKQLRIRKWLLENFKGCDKKDKLLTNLLKGLEYY
jgi:hypothetical protein